MPYIANTDADQQDILDVIGCDSIRDLFCDIPGHLILKNDLELLPALSEMELSNVMTEISQSNLLRIRFMGGGSYLHYIPATVGAVIGMSEFYTAYTSYQPEISQGTLQAIFEYQSMICDMTGMDVANASMYDGATSLAEAMLMACIIKQRRRVLVSQAIHPHYRAVLQTYAQAHDIEITLVGICDGVTDQAELGRVLGDDIAAVLIQIPNFLGCIEDLKAIRDLDPEMLLVTSTTEVLSWAYLKPLGSFGVDIVTAEGQSFGNAMNFGGPGLGIMAVRSAFVRQIPGRLVGQTTDAHGRRGYVLTLAAREQHIRREKATSNICSNEGLCALSAAVYLATMGKSLLSLAELNHHLACYFVSRLAQKDGVSILYHQPFFNEFVIRVNDSVRERLGDFEIGIDLAQYYPDMVNCFLVCVTEMTPEMVIDKALQYF